MPATQSGARLKEIARQWHDLAERRLACYEEIYRSGRWQHYFRTKEEFAARMLDVIEAAKTFRRLAEFSPSRSAASEAAMPASAVRPAA
jgi:hypothetical protein